MKKINPLWPATRSLNNNDGRWQTDTHTGRPAGAQTAQGTGSALLGEAHSLELCLSGSAAPARALADTARKANSEQRARKEEAKEKRAQVYRLKLSCICPSLPLPPPLPSFAFGAKSTMFDWRPWAAFLRPLAARPSGSFIDARGRQSGATLGRSSKSDPQSETSGEMQI